MKRAVVLAPAKLNLALDILGRRPDGYHTVDMIMQAVDLCDRVTVERTEDERICLCLPGSDLPVDERNTAYKAAVSFFETAKIVCPGVRITVEKRIPMQAGMAGGSADAAGVLAALNALWDAPLTDAQLYAAGASVGADVPFCQMGGAARATGIGTHLAPIPALPDCAVLAVKPAVGVSTAEAYRAVDSVTLTRRPDIPAMLRALNAGDLVGIGAYLCNVFEEAIALPEVTEIRTVALAAGAVGCIMTGSGSAVFALFTDSSKAVACQAALSDRFPNSWLCHPCSGPQIIDIE
ncbi:MAG: 4-(cytidine 5'-diphospho)-2-C-methyl-D-erythritol kinase [Clostridia bacterium]|nr:4-(cytidine 5'-diphospho)-2-C-methyl-D-erythritol kinase [Clostridia bacterium]